MKLVRSTFYRRFAGQRLEDARLVEQIGEICAEYPSYGYRRVKLQLRRNGVTVNHKKAMKLMREQGLSVRPRRRYVKTTDSDHGSPIFPNLARDIALSGPNQLWVADLTYIAIAHNFAYLAVILDAWSRRVVGYALARFMDSRLTLAALNSAIESRKPQPDASIIRIADRSTRPRRIANCSRPTGCGARWDAAAIPTITPRPRAS
jgi:putative transposase